MIKILRKHRNWLMIVIAILALPFCLYFVKSDTSLIRGDTFAQLYGRKIRLIEKFRNDRLVELAGQLGMTDFLKDLTTGAQTREDALALFTINLTIVRHEADRLGIDPSDSEIIEAVRNFPFFHGASGFDSAKYDLVAKNVLPSLGFTDEQLRELAHDELCLTRLKELVGSAVSIPESEIKSDYEQRYGKNFATVVRVKATDLTKDIKVSDDEIKKYYDAHQSELKTEEKRKVEFVRLGLTEDQKKLKDKERIDALQKLADRANDFSQALLEKNADFKQVAAKVGFQVESTGEFTPSAPDPKLNTDPQLSQAAFKLTQQEPNSDPIQVANGYAVLHLDGVVEARPMSLDEAKSKITETIKNDRSREMAVAKGRKAVEILREGLKNKQPLQFILEQAGGLKAEKLEPFTLADDLDEQNAATKPKNDSVEMMVIKNVASQLQPGQVSEFAPAIDGGLIVILDKREAPDAAKYQEAKAKFEDEMTNQERAVVLFEWLRDRRVDAGLQYARS